jgi:hypothetical protein
VTRVYLGLAANGVVYLAVGYALLYALGLARLRRGDLRLAGLAYLAGWALLGVALSVALSLGAHLGLPGILLVAALLVAVCGAVGTRVESMPAPRVDHGGHPVARTVAAIAAAILAIELVAALVVAVQNLWTPDIDVMTAWLPRAEIVYYSHQLEPASWSQFVTPWYPPLAPAMYAVAFHFVGGFHPSALALQQTILGVAFLGAVLAILDRFTPRWISLPTLAALTSVPWFWWRLHSLLPDQTLAYLLVAAALACAIWLHERGGAWLGLATVLLAAATLTKIEGTLFGGLLALSVIVAALVARRRAGLPGLVLLLGPAMTLPWRFWLTQHQVATSTPDYNAPNVLSTSFLSARFDRLTFALEFMLRGPFGVEWLTGVLVCVALAVAVVVAWRLAAVTLALGAWLVLSFLALAAIYWTSRVEIHFYVGTSASRVGTTLIVAGVVLAPLLLGLALHGAPERDDVPRSL